MQDCFHWWFPESLDEMHFHSSYLHKVTSQKKRKKVQCSNIHYFTLPHWWFPFGLIISQDEGLLSWCHSQYTHRCPETAAPCERDRKYSVSFWGEKKNNVLKLNQSIFIGSMVEITMFKVALHSVSVSFSTWFWFSTYKKSQIFF